MKKSDTFSDRRNEAAAAKARLVEQFKTRPTPDSPEVVKRLAARQLQNAANSERNAKAASKKKAILQRLKTDAATAEASRKEQRLLAEQTKVAEERNLKNSVEATEAQELLDEAARKTRRDARYASRKARR